MQYLTTSMDNMVINQRIWEQMIKKQVVDPIDFSVFEHLYDIKKLELEKLPVFEIEQKSREWQQKQADIPPNKFRNWMENQYRIFIWLLLSLIHHGYPVDSYNHPQWSQIGKLFGKQGIVCEYFYLASKKNKASSWTQPEDQIFFSLMNTMVNEIKWTEVGILLFQHSGREKVHRPKAIRERWLNKLNPLIKKSNWSTQEDLNLLNYTEQNGKKWSKISKIFGTRNEHTIKNRYHQIIVRKLSKINSEKCQKITEQELVEKTISELKRKYEKQEKGEKMLVEESSHFSRENLSQNTEIKVEDKGVKLLEQKPRVFLPIIIQKNDFQI